MKKFEAEVLNSILAQKDEVFLTLTRTCNNNCIFCIDLPFHTGALMKSDKIYQEIIKGANEGKENLLLSGGEPTLHPDFISFVQFGKSVGYKNITAITNGRKFSEMKFCKESINAGLNEVIFSLHGNTNEMHNRLAARKSAFEQTVQGIKNMGLTGKCILHVQIIVNKINYKFLPEIVDNVFSLKVGKLTFINVMPTEDSYKNYRDFLFYNVEEAIPYLKQAITRAGEHNVTVHMKKFPLLIYDALGEMFDFPAHFVQEIINKNRKTNIFTNFLSSGDKMPCFGGQCKLCFLKEFCKFLLKFHRDMNTVGFKYVEFDLLECNNRIKEHFVKLCHRNKHIRIYIKTHSVRKALWFIRRRRLQNKDIVLVLKSSNVMLYKKVVLNGQKICEKVNRDKLFPLNTLLQFAINSHSVRWLRDNKNWLYHLNGNIIFSFSESYGEISVKEFLQELQLDKVKILGLPRCVHPCVETVYPKNMLRYDMVNENGAPSIEGLAKYFYSELYFSKGTRCTSCAYQAECRGFPLSFLKVYGFSLLNPVSKKT